VLGNQVAGGQPRYSVLKERVWVLVSRYLFLVKENSKRPGRKKCSPYPWRELARAIRKLPLIALILKTEIVINTDFIRN
jgi:hypothetical protein